MRKKRIIKLKLVSQMKISFTYVIMCYIDFKKLKVYKLSLVHIF